jgi:hypothetical protein
VQQEDREVGEAFLDAAHVLLGKGVVKAEFGPSFPKRRFGFIVEVGREAATSKSIRSGVSRRRLLAAIHPPGSAGLRGQPPAAGAWAAGARSVSLLRVHDAGVWWAEPMRPVHPRGSLRRAVASSP